MQSATFCSQLFCLPHPGSRQVIFKRSLIFKGHFYYYYYFLNRPASWKGTLEDACMCELLAMAILSAASWSKSPQQPRGWETFFFFFFSFLLQSDNCLWPSKLALANSLASRADCDGPQNSCALLAALVCFSKASAGDFGDAINSGFQRPSSPPPWRNWEDAWKKTNLIPF